MRQELEQWVCKGCLRFCKGESQDLPGQYDEEVCGVVQHEDTLDDNANQFR